MEDANETRYVEKILSIIDYNFIRRTDKDLTNMSDAQIKHLILIGNDNIIVSKKHTQIVTQNDLFDYDFYKSHYPKLANKNPTDVLNHYLIYGNNRKYIVSHAHAQLLTKNSLFNIDLYKSYHSDLLNMSPTKLVCHYIRIGKKGNRRCS